MQELQITPTRKDALAFAQYLKDHPQPETITFAIKDITSLSPLIQPGIVNAGYIGDGRWHKPEHTPSWKRMEIIYAAYLALICGTAWAITHWSPSIEVLCAVLVFAVVACFIVHRNTGGKADVKQAQP